MSPTQTFIFAHTKSIIVQEPHSRMTSPARRVLGDKDRNAHLNIRSPKSTLLKTMSPPANAITTKKTPGMAQLSSSPRAGSKRKIEEVEDAERVELEQHENSQRTQLLSDSECGDECVEHPTSNAHTSYETAETSFNASQIALEPQFELQQEEMSQRTLEKLNDVPMPQNTSQLPPSRIGLLRETSAGSIGLSSFINFEGAPSTQGSDAMQMLEPVDKEQKKEAEHQDEKREESPGAVARKRMLDEKAAELRTRLQLALYKVETRQTSQPFSRLKTPKPQRERSISPPTTWMPTLGTPQLSSSTIKQPSSARTIAPTHQDDRSIDSAEAHIAAMRAQAANQLKPAVRNLNSLPVPQLDPSLMVQDTSFDSNKTQQIGDDGSQGTQQFPSSPPLSRQPSTSIEEQLLSGMQEAAEKEKEGGAQQLSSPPISEGGAVEVGMAKTVSQGEAASGLVQLMTGATGI
ncbi:hypothetical protein LTR24_010153 [Lithohypha guttulata]|uniref:Uncharacterized protein n=1 Tax=Lithohypha guttulata TaxID=1690604 RepID=A0ABR0JV81_9EURO|nr:hypothetical protein LTR24_010153 [Lithohypha guttulata]